MTIVCFPCNEQSHRPVPPVFELQYYWDVVRDHVQEGLRGKL